MRVFTEYPEILGLSLLALALPALAGEQPSTAMLDQVQCDAVLRDAGTGREFHLSRTHHDGRYLRVGDSVKCNSDGFLTIMWGSQEIEVKKQASAVKPLADVAVQGERERLAAEALSYHNSAAGTRGASGRILFPVAGSVVWPEDFVIRWRPQTHPGDIALSIYAPGSSQPLWQDREVDGTAGKLESADLKRALTSYRSISPQNAILTLEWRSATSGFNVPFSLLTLDQEKALEKELDIWNQTQNPLLRAVGRAYSFASRNLLWDEAQNYEEALKIAPASCDLLNETEAAEEQVKNWERVRESERSLEAGHCSDRDR